MAEDAPEQQRRARVRRGGRRKTRWLLTERGTLYSLGVPRKDVAGFHVHYQDGEGRLWRRLCDRAGAPVVLPIAVTRAEVLAQVPIRRGAIQLVPVRADGSAAGTAPQMIHLA